RPSTPSAERGNVFHPPARRHSGRRCGGGFPAGGGGRGGDARTPQSAASRASRSEDRRAPRADREDRVSRSGVEPESGAGAAAQLAAESGPEGLCVADAAGGLSPNLGAAIRLQQQSL